METFSQLSQDNRNSLMKFKEMVLEKNKVMNLTALTTEEQFMHKHFADSLKILDYVNVEGRVLDLGTGAGFPGIPLAIVCSDTEFVLLDSLKKRVNFLEEVASELGLKNVSFLHARAEDAARTELRASFDYVVTRALASLPTLLELTIPFLKKDGKLYAYKGEKVFQEIESSKKALKALGTELGEVYPYKILGDDHYIVELKKVCNTALSYPRKPNQIAKRPL